jgi:hypothetical protein
VVFLLLAIAAAVASAPLWWPRWRTVALPRRMLVAVVALCAAVTAALGGAHLVVVVIQLSGKAYDFRAYSLLLLGVVLVLPAIVCGATIPGLLRGERRARRGALAAFLWLLAINAALIPLQGFAILLTLAATVGIAALLAISRTAPGSAGAPSSAP